MQGLTRTQLLEENISLLEARIRELEDPLEPSPIMLHDYRSNPSERSTVFSAFTPSSGKYRDLIQWIVF
jgi:hypothetical protein